MKERFVIGTRGSRLALWQSEWVKMEIERRFPGVTVELEIIRTRGDRILDVPLAKVGGKGLFVKEIEDALLSGRVDMAVHSMKDMPAKIPEGLVIGAVPKREDPRDALICASASGLSELPEGAKVGTASLRRSAQLLAARPDLQISSLRGNLDTRLKKLETGGFDAIVLAAAGLKRMEMDNRISEHLPVETVLPAVGQGALCVEIRENDPEVAPIMAALDDPETRTVVLGERAFLHRLEGGCQTPIAGHGHLDENGVFHMTGLVASLDGKTVIREDTSGPGAESESLGRDLADLLRERGAAEILASVNPPG
ncbi:MAG: hydroxymethylbilane synthase [Desulfobacterales bacterium]|nr:MAG: hydroxymethylbilane synthase [Desulfobacterales bacterium]